MNIISKRVVLDVKNMNIALLILGVFFIILSLILIILNSNSVEETKPKLEVKIKEQPNPLDLLEKKDIKIKDEYISSFETSLKENYNEKKIEKQKPTQLENIERVEKIEKTIEVVEETHDKVVSSIESTRDDITDKIIKMHKEGYKVNEIAKKLEKGIREIEIILKVNNID